MLPDISLDEESYDEILDEAMNMVISKYPRWTDFNEHDPGITMLELWEEAGAGKYDVSLF